MRMFLVPLLTAALLAVWVGPSPGQTEPSAARFPAVSNDDAWKQLPREEPPLPEWSRILVQSLPRTTAGMLELDYLHRAKNPLGPVLAGKLRWVAADAIGSAYAKRYAEADLRRAGLKDADLKQLVDGGRDLPEAEQLALDFARKMTTAAHTVTDSQVETLLKEFGPDKVVAMVHTLAFANFQNRIILALGVEVEKDGPFPPVEVRFDQEKLAKLKAPARPAWEEVEKVKAVATLAKPDWKDDNFGDLQKTLERQKERKSRIPLPDPARLANLPPEAKAQATKIVWTNVSMGYQPMMTKLWFDCMTASRQERKMDPVFSGSLFWVVTRTNQCFY